MTDGPEFTEVKRTPILLNAHTVMLIQLFHASHDNLSDMWTWDIIDGRSEQESAAAQLMAQLGEHWTGAFLMALRKAITAKLLAHDQVHGTRWAEETPHAD